MSLGTDWTALKLEVAYASGAWRLLERSRGGAGIILKFTRVRPARSAAFQPLRAQEITPQFLHRLIIKLKGWPFDIVSMDEACRRVQTPPAGRRFVALTFDGGTRDFIEFAWPLLSGHQVPFTVYLPAAFPDGLGRMWWLALEQVVGRHDRINVIIDDVRRYFETADIAGKVHAHHYLNGWLRSLPQRELDHAIDDLCLRYDVDLAALSRAVAMTWDDVAIFAGDPLATIGTSTLNYPVLAHLDEAAATREMAMGQAVAAAALPEPPRHFAFPFGDAASFSLRDVSVAREQGFVSAATSVPGVVRAGAELHALPRLAWDGRRTSLRVLRAMMSGLL
ncbi:polysaccharide deacetylase family protein [Rhodopseudomonas boonkerdii]|uniref:polysaccharide deacetylase family protein n=1 Tax=Rhodopseudomonas boonkerdii TaxID=475937 RepID=UPI001E2F6423|nr:polysaccharide deacetylase family protein [Rhodopseudomonas boonkerdii]